MSVDPKLVVETAPELIQFVATESAHIPSVDEPAMGSRNAGSTSNALC
ncbi:hypothetical protein [Undibacterium sp. CY21W]|nr:hypothetical protein [Undibacterium sp. CY21W]MBC3930027.1 hypothetical protein [Undibacterium sp. CY21W]